MTTALLDAFFSKGGIVQGTVDSARTQLQKQYAQEYLSVADPKTAEAWLDALLVLELAADLHEKEEMYIYDFVADPAQLAGGQLFAFTGFFEFFLNIVSTTTITAAPWRSSRSSCTENAQSIFKWVALDSRAYQSDQTGVQ